MAEPRQILTPVLVGPLLALCWLTRLPLGRFLPDPAPPLRSALWAFPLAGIVVGAGGALVLAAALWLGLTPLLAGLLAVGAQIWLTGGLHEDGLADLADGMGGTTRERRLEIMRDSRIGSYGALVLGLVTALRVAALAALTPAVAVTALIAAAALSRAGMVLALHLMPPARHDGLGRGAGRASRRMALVALALGLSPFFIAMLVGLIPVVAILVAPVACLCAQAMVGRQAILRLGGQTGDVLGAIQQVGCAAILLALAALTGQAGA